MFLNSQTWFLQILEKIGQETKKLWRIYCALTWNSPIFDHLSKISTIFPFDQVSISIKFNSSMVKDDSYQFWRRLVEKQKNKCRFYCALTWNSPIFDHLSKISTIFSFDKIFILIRYCSSIFKDDSYKFWRGLVKKQKIMAILLCSNMKFADNQSFIQYFDHFSIR